MEAITEFVLLLRPTPIFAGIQQIANVVALAITPVLFLIAIYTRVVETQIEGIVSGGKWDRAIRDILLWGVVLGLYFSIGALITNFFNSIYSWIDQYGSLRLVTEKFEAFVQIARAKNNSQETSLLEDGISLASLPYNIVTIGLYYLTLILVASLIIFLSIAHALTFGAAFIWGLVAIPMTITQHFKLLRGWGLVMGLALVWPIIQGIFIALFVPLFVGAADVLLSDPNSNTNWDIANVRLLFVVMHLLIAAIVVAAPFVAQALVANAPSAAAIVAPFVGAAVTAAVATAKAMQAKGGMGGGGIPRTGPINTPTPGAQLRRVSQQPRPLAPPARSAPRTTPTAPAPVAQGGGTPAAGPAGAATPSQSTAPAPSRPHTNPVPNARDSGDPSDGSSATAASADKQRRRQARRGAILNQRKTRG